jgi:hypothetical protein
MGNVGSAALGALAEGQGAEGVTAGRLLRKRRLAAHGQRLLLELGQALALRLGGGGGLLRAVTRWMLADVMVCLDCRTVTQRPAYGRR